PRIRPGMTSLLSIPVASASDVLAIPLAAVFTEKGERFVFAKKDEKDEKFERRPVLIGITDYSFAEVQEGLEAGEIVSLEQPAEFRNSTSTNGPAPGRSPKTAGMGATSMGNSSTATRGSSKQDGATAERSSRRATGS